MAAGHVAERPLLSRAVKCVTVTSRSWCASEVHRGEDRRLRRRHPLLTPVLFIDSVRQYIPHIVREAATVITEIETVDVSRQAKNLFFVERMGERMFSETESYRKSKESSPKSQDVSVLVSFPVGLNEMILRTVDYTGLFSSNQDLIKTSVHWMFGVMEDISRDAEIVSGWKFSDCLVMTTSC